MKHVNEVKQSFQDKHYEDIKEMILEDFNFANVSYALGEIEKYEMLKYDSLDYPLFKINILNSRIK